MSVTGYRLQLAPGAPFLIRNPNEATGSYEWSNGRVLPLDGPLADGLRMTGRLRNGVLRFSGRKGSMICRK